MGHCRSQCLCSVRPILIEDPKFLFPTSLQQVAVYRSLHNAVAGDTFRAAKQMKASLLVSPLRCSQTDLKVFWYVFAGFFIWQCFPEYIFPFTAALAPLCWFASQNHVVNFIGAGRGGMGFLNITLDWSNITSTIVTFPFSTQVTVFLGFVLTVSQAAAPSDSITHVQTWILIPVSYFGELWGSPKYPVMSNQVFAQNGTKYPFTKMRESAPKMSRLVSADTKFTLTVTGSNSSTRRWSADSKVLGVRS